MARASLAGTKTIKQSVDRLGAEEGDWELIVCQAVIIMVSTEMWLWHTLHVLRILDGPLLHYIIDNFSIPISTKESKN